MGLYYKKKGGKITCLSVQKKIGGVFNAKGKVQNSSIYSSYNA